MAAKWPSGGRASQAIKHKSSKNPSQEKACHIWGWASESVQLKKIIQGKELLVLRPNRQPSSRYVGVYKSRMDFGYYCK